MCLLYDARNTTRSCEEIEVSGLTADWSIVARWWDALQSHKSMPGRQRHIYVHCLLEFKAHIVTWEQIYTHDKHTNNKIEVSPMVDWKMKPHGSLFVRGELRQLTKKGTKDVLCLNQTWL